MRLLISLGIYFASIPLACIASLDLVSCEKNVKIKIVRHNVSANKHGFELKQLIDINQENKKIYNGNSILLRFPSSIQRVWPSIQFPWTKEDIASRLNTMNRSRTRKSSRDGRSGRADLSWVRDHRTHDDCARGCWEVNGGSDCPYYRSHFVGSGHGGWRITII